MEVEGELSEYVSLGVEKRENKALSEQRGGTPVL